ncbi:MAG: ferrochelatase [Pseudomonadota bacterium]
MKSQQAEFQHDSPETLGVLLVNLGTPASPDKPHVRRYLKEFLWDPRVVEVPRPIWWLVLNGVILNTRPRRSAEAYARIWTDAGSPLLVISRQQHQAMQAALQTRLEVPVKVSLAMRYGEPSIAAGLAELRESGARKVLVLPLYPQYSASATASVFDAITTELQNWRWVPEVRFVNHYHDDPAYIAALAGSVRGFQAKHGKPDKLVMSFHGIPKEYFLKGDPYHCECQKTARLLAGALGLADDEWVLTFQSRLGPKEWLKPYTDATLKRLASEGVPKIQVICPGFSADCLETLEEIAMENKANFLSAGGKEYGYIPCLNTEPAHIEALADLVLRHSGGWLDAAAWPNTADLQQRRERALALGAKT